MTSGSTFIKVFVEPPIERGRGWFRLSFDDQSWLAPRRVVMSTPPHPRRPRVLFLTPQLPYPPRTGGRIKSWKLVEYLSQHFRLGVACALKEDDARFVDEFRARVALEDFVAEAVEVPRSLRALARSYVENVPLNVLRTRSEALARRVAALAPRYDLILSDHYEVFQYVPRDYTRPVVLHEHNAYFLMWQRYAETAGRTSMRLAAWLESLRVRRYELDACRRASLVFAAPNDLETLVRAGAERARFRLTHHLGDDAASHRPRLDRAATELSVLYVGSLTWEPNVDGLIWFLESAWPELKRRHPGLRFRIAGGGTDPRLSAWAARDPSVELLGFVEDLEPLFTRSRVLVAPLRYGAGIKVKVLTALARGIPCVTTRVGAEGVALVPMRHIAIADDAQQMAEHVSRLLVDEVWWTTLSREGRAHVEAHYSWDRVLDAMRAELDGLLGSGAPAPPRAGATAEHGGPPP